MIEFFTDPVLSSPTIGSMLMCALAAFVGTFAVLKKQSLVGETLSHACYPGVIIALLLSKLFFEASEEVIFIPMLGAALSCVLGMYIVQRLQKVKVSPDSALCFVLSSFFGVALLILSTVQVSFPTLYKELQSYLFGQAATLTSIFVTIYIIVASVILSTVALFYRAIKTVIFDLDFAKTIGIRWQKIDLLLLGITVLAVVIGIRSLGVVLLSSMLIFPAISCRFWTARLEILLCLSALFGLVCGFFGVYFSHQMSQSLQTAFPTGPMIVLVAFLLFLFSSLFSPQRGILFCLFRKLRFWNHCQQENLLKAAWKACSGKKSPLITRSELEHIFHTTPYTLWLLLRALERRGWMRSKGYRSFELTALGMLWGRKIIRLHRLWEVYLVEYCGLRHDRVHPSAEEMEHIITEEMENELLVLLDHPHVDPHQQPIPKPERSLLQP